MALYKELSVAQHYLPHTKPQAAAIPYEDTRKLYLTRDPVIVTVSGCILFSILLAHPLPPTPASACALCRVYTVPGIYK